MPWVGLGSEDGGEGERASPAGQVGCQEGARSFPPSLSLSDEPRNGESRREKPMDGEGKERESRRFRRRRPIPFLFAFRRPPRR